MAIGDHPNVFRYEGKMWVSEQPREIALAQLVEQRAWDATNARLQRWWVAIAIGAVVGTAGTLALGTAAGLSPGIYLVLLPLGFGAGAVLGAVVNKRFTPDAQHSSLGPRPVITPLTRVPPRVARNAPPEASAKELIGWATRGFVS